MARKSYVREMADYILSQDHERDYVKDVLISEIESAIDGHRPNKSQLRKSAETTIWYKTLTVAYGRAFARKEVTELLNEL